MRGSRWWHSAIESCKISKLIDVLSGKCMVRWLQVVPVEYLMKQMQQWCFDVANLSGDSVGCWHESHGNRGESEEKEDRGEHLKIRSGLKLTFYWRGCSTRGDNRVRREDTAYFYYFSNRMHRMLNCCWWRWLERFLILFYFSIILCWCQRRAVYSVDQIQDPNYSWRAQ